MSKTTAQTSNPNVRRQPRGEHHTIPAFRCLDCGMWVELDNDDGVHIFRLNSLTDHTITVGHD